MELVTDNKYCENIVSKRKQHFDTDCLCHLQAALPMT